MKAYRQFKKRLRPARVYLKPRAYPAEVNRAPPGSSSARTCKADETLMPIIGTSIHIARDWNMS
jgi:hypothetical protein